MRDKKSILAAIMSVLLSVILVAVAVSARTTVGNDITVDSNLTVTATSTLATTTATQLAANQLDVVGEVTLADTLTVSSTSTLSGDLLVNSNTLYVDSNDDAVGIGTTTPYNTLVVIGAINNTGALVTDGAVSLGDTLTVTATSTLATTTLTMLETSGEAVLMSNVGIATTSPKFRLEVVGTSTDGFFGVSHNTPGDLFTIDNSGNVGIGTVNPDSALDVVGNVDIADGSLWQPVYGSNDGLVICLPFSENTGIATYDHSPKGNDGTITDGEGDQWATGKYGYGLDLGDGDYVAAGASGVSKSQGTAELWVKPGWDGDDDAAHYFFDNSSGTFKNRLSLYKWTDNRLYFWYAGPTDWSGIMLSYDISSWSSGEWHHLAVTWSSSMCKLYIDGQLVTSGSPDTEPASLRNTFYVGTDWFLINDSDGVVFDEFRVYSRILDQDEIRTHYLREEQGSVITADQFRVVDTSATTKLIIDTSGNVGIGTTAPQSLLQLETPANSTYKYLQIDSEAGAPAAGDCDDASEQGRMVIDHTNNRLYICNQAAARGWDYIDLTD